MEPVKRRADVRRIREYFRKNYKHGGLYALLWTCGCNLGLRAGDLRRLTYGQLCAERPVTFAEEKNGTIRTLYINASIRAALEAYRAEQNLIFISDGAFLFWGQKGCRIEVKHMHRLIKDACAAIGLMGNYGSHTMRKTFGYHAYRRSRTEQNLRLVQEAYGHSRQRYTQIYTGVDKEMKPYTEGNPRRSLEDLYMSLNL